ncbi:MAG: aspartate carbamoyltransferase regulatory subunit [Leptotrichiaceae bacterium]|nr:aspartate carbamoyltransferase regulatory subunit [Leptotrichiaceae bacterium]
MELQITALKNGIVIDHIPVEKTFPIVEILHLREYGEIVTVACNLKSSSLGKKGLIKIEDRSLGENELGEIAILAPDVTINIIENFKVVKKIKLAIPNEITGLIKCNNNKCISNYENIETKFIKIIERNKIKYKCFYCERVTAENEIELKPL